MVMHEFLSKCNAYNLMKEQRLAVNGKQIDRNDK